VLFSRRTNIWRSGNASKELLNHQQEFLSARTVKSTRAVGDAIQDVLTENFESLLGEGVCKKFSSEFARRAMADLAF